MRGRDYCRSHHLKMPSDIQACWINFGRCPSRSFAKEEGATVAWPVSNISLYDFMLMMPFSSASSSAFSIPRSQQSKTCNVRVIDLLCLIATRSLKLQTLHCIALHTSDLIHCRDWKSCADLLCCSWTPAGVEIPNQRSETLIWGTADCDNHKAMMTFQFSRWSIFLISLVNEQKSQISQFFFSVKRFKFFSVTVQQLSSTLPLCKIGFPKELEEKSQVDDKVPKAQGPYTWPAMVAKLNLTWMLTMMVIVTLSTNLCRILYFHCMKITSLYNGWWWCLRCSSQINKHCAIRTEGAVFFSLFPTCPTLDSQRFKTADFFHLPHHRLQQK